MVNFVNKGVFFSKSSEYKLKEGHIEKIKEMIDGPQLGDKECDRKETRIILKWVLECVSYSDIITLFDIRRI